MQEVNFLHAIAVMTQAAPKGTRRASRAAQANFYLFGALGTNSLYQNIRILPYTHSFGYEPQTQAVAQPAECLDAPPNSAIDTATSIPWSRVFWIMSSAAERRFRAMDAPAVCAC